MADSMWDRVKDFACRHVPQRVQRRMDQATRDRQAAEEYDAAFGPDVQRKLAIEGAAPIYAVWGPNKHDQGWVPTTSQEQRDAGRAAAPPQDQSTHMAQRDMQKSNDRGLER